MLVFFFPVTSVKNPGTACTIRRFKEKEQSRYKGIIMMNTKESEINKLYEDAALLHRIHTEKVFRRDRFLNYWQHPDRIN